MLSKFPYVRLRRLRSSKSVRDLFQETQLNIKNLVLPIFVEEKIDDFTPISSMPGVLRIPEKKLAAEIQRYSNAGISSIMLFGIPHSVDEIGTDTMQENGLASRIVKIVKTVNPEMVVMSDCCFCGYTSHGHCGVLEGVIIDNDNTLNNLIKTAVLTAAAGADFICPSSAMDGQVKEIRDALDSSGFHSTGIISYSSKFSSALYGPFREAAGSKLKGDRETYQMNPMNRREAIRESLMDESEGSDVLMVKPAGGYLDIIRDIREASKLPLAAYQVSGEYSMIKFAAEKGAINERDVVRESLGSIKRAGADIILTYFAMDIAIEGI